jgi:hypothetical protein
MKVNLGGGISCGNVPPVGVKPKQLDTRPELQAGRLMATGLLLFFHLGTVLHIDPRSAARWDNLQK